MASVRMHGYGSIIEADKLAASMMRGREERDA